MPDTRRLLIDLTIMVGIGLLLAVLGPFGTFAAPFALRLAYWLGIAVAGYAMYLPAMVMATRLSRRLQLPEAGLWIAACVAATLPMTIVVWAADATWRPLRTVSAQQWLASYVNVLILGSAITSVFWFGRMRRGATVAPVAEAAPATESAPVPTDPAEPPPTISAAPFLDRLPSHLGRDLIALEMEDHYVRAHTAAGSTLILMRMRDAAAELAPVDGRLIHRSWWVARDHVTGVARDGRNLRMILTGGIEAPVARGQVDALQAAGWLGRPGRPRGGHDPDT